MNFYNTIDFTVGNEVWFIKHYCPSNRIPYDTYKVRKGILYEIIPNVKVIVNDKKTILQTSTNYIIKGLPNDLFENVYHTEAEALEVFKQSNLKEYYR